MSALPRPDLPPGPHRDLVDALHDLHHRAGWPSLRRLAADTGVSHTTVSKALSSPALPTWGTLELLVEAMDGDQHRFHELWLAASAPVHGAASTPRIAGRVTELAAVRRHLETGTGPPPRHRRGRHRQDQARHHLSRDHRHLRRRRALPAPVDRGAPAAVGGRAAAAHERRRGPVVRGSPRRVPRLRPRLACSPPPETSPRSRRTRTTRLASDCSWPSERCSTHSRSRRPLALLLEDLHWADASTLDAPGAPAGPRQHRCRWSEPGAPTTPAHPSRHARGGSGCCALRRRPSSRCRS